MSIPTGDITNHNLLWYNPNDGRVVCSNAGTTGRFGGAALDTASLPGAVSALRLPSTYTPVVFGAGLDTANVHFTSVVVGSQDSSIPGVGGSVTAVGYGSLRGNVGGASVVIGNRESYSGTCGFGSVCIGNAAGDNTSDFCVSIGLDSMKYNATGPKNSTAIGWGAGFHDAGNDCLYLGHAAGENGGHFDNVICLGAVKIPTQSDSFFVKPVRKVDGSGAGSVLSFDAGTSEITWGRPVFPKWEMRGATFFYAPLLADREKLLSTASWEAYPTPKVLTFTLSQPRTVRVTFDALVHVTTVPATQTSDTENIVVHGDNSFIQYSQWGW